MDHNDQAEDRFLGFVAAMREAGRSVPEAHIVTALQPTTIEFGHAAMLGILELSPHVDAVFLQADGLAHGAAMACMGRAIAIPDTIALAGFGDLSLSALLPIPLTTVRARGHVIGAETARPLVGRIKGEQVESTIVDVGYEVLARASA